jgi:hypothetical protein
VTTGVDANTVASAAIENVGIVIADIVCSVSQCMRSHADTDASVAHSQPAGQPAGIEPGTNFHMQHHRSLYIRLRTQIHPLHNS